MLAKRSAQRPVELEAAITLLREAYGPVTERTPRPPIDELVMTILSQHTSDANTARAFAILRHRFPQWSDVADAQTEDIAAAIHSGGLANVKAPVIRSVLRTIEERTGDHSLELLSAMSDAEALEWLTALHGVGPKTAACVLLFSMNRPIMPVDTHVHRVALRLGVLAPGTSALRAHGQLERQIPAESMYDAHMLLIRHGRVTCRARAPRCWDCVLETHCPSAELSAP